MTQKMASYILLERRLLNFRNVYTCLHQRIMHELKCVKIMACSFPSFVAGRLKKKHKKEKVRKLWFGQFPCMRLAMYWSWFVGVAGTKTFEDHDLDT